MALRSSGANLPIGWLNILIVDGLVFSSPESAESSSSWPLPATPPIPNISPTRTEKLMFDNEVPKKSLVRIERFETFNNSSPNARVFLEGLEKDLPTIISPICFALVSLGIQDPTFFPFRRIVA